MAGSSCDIIVIGGGIAGVSAAAELAATARVTLLEMENQVGFHATGRSAAYFSSAYGNEVVRGMTAASEHWFRRPPADFCDVNHIRPRDCVFVGRADQCGQLAELESEVSRLQLQTPEEIRAEIPILREGYLGGGLRDATGGDLDVDSVLQAYLRLFERRGGELFTASCVEEINYSSGCWVLRCGNESYAASVVVNAAGAWADCVAKLAGLKGLGIAPKRRTALLIDAPSGTDISDWPLVVDVEEQFYFKPDVGQLLISPANEDESIACDVQAHELDIAIAVDRFMQACDVDVRRINHSWAGLRSFAADKTFVVGFDPRSSGFFWLAGQGGYGVQSAPGMAQLTAHLIANTTLTADFRAVLNYREAVAPDRLIGT